MSSYSKPPYPLRAVTAAGGLPDLRRAQLCASPAPSLHRLYASEGCPRPAPRQPAHHQATCRLHKASSATAAIHPGHLPFQIRHFSSTGNVLQPLRKLSDPKAMWYLKVLGLALFSFMVSHWIHWGRQYSERCAIMLKKVGNDMREQFETVNEAFETCEKAVHLLEDNRWDDKAFSMLHQGMDDLFKAQAIYYKVLGDSIKVIRSFDGLMTLPLLERYMLLKSMNVCIKEMEDHVEIMRQRMKNLSVSLDELRKGAKGSFPGQLGS